MSTPTHSTERMNLRRTGTVSGLWVIAAVCAWFSSAHAADLVVIVSFSGQPGPTRPLGYVLQPNGMLPIGPPVSDPRREAVIEVFAAQAQTPRPDLRSLVRAPPQTQTLTILGQRFLSHLLLLAQDGVLLLRNDDTTEHTVELVPALVRWPSVRLGPKETVSLRMPQADTLKLSLRTQPFEQATVYAPPHPAMHLALGPTRTMGVARFDVPPGRYRLR